MRKRICSVLLMAVFITAVLMNNVSFVYASQDSVGEFSLACKNAVENGQSEVTVNTSRTDVEVLFDEMFVRYPILYHYYGGASWTTYSDHSEVTVKFKNIEDDFDDFWVVDSDEDLFAVLAAGLAELRPSVKFVIANGYQYSDDTIEAIFSHLQHQYPLAYMGHHGWSAHYYSNEDIGVYDYEFTFNYFYDLDPGTIRQWRNETEQVALYLAGSLFAQDMPDYLKVLRIHDWIINNTRYNTANMDEPGNHLAYGALVKGSCVCMGYAEAAIMLFQAAGIETQYVSGDGTNSSGETESHAWNAVKLGGEWYMLDLTWDDPVMDDGSNVLRYDYFNVTSAQLAKDHDWDYADAPQCNGTLYTASYVQELAKNDSAIYSDFDVSRLVTQEEAIVYFRSLLEQIPVELPQMQSVTSEPETQPVADTQPVVPETNPVQDTHPVADTQPTTETAPVNPPQPSNESEGGGIWILVAVAVVLAGGGSVVAVRIAREKRRQEELENRRRMQDYDLSNLPKSF